MSRVWEQLTETERHVLKALHAGGASPRLPAQKPAQFLVLALRQAGIWPMKAEKSLLHMHADLMLSPVAEKFDKALRDLVWRPRDGLQLVDGRYWGNWGSPDGSKIACHPLFRECRLSLAGQRLVVEIAQKNNEIIIPDFIGDDVLGKLRWNPSEVWWERDLKHPSGNAVRFSVFQDIPGRPLDLEPSRRTLCNILEKENDICEAILVEAKNPDFWMHCNSDELREVKELKDNVLLRGIQINATGGGKLEFHVIGWDNFRIIVEIELNGGCELIHILPPSHTSNSSATT